MKIELIGTKNTRDFSEYGHPGFIRSAHMHEITGEDAGRLKDEYNLKTVIDLRTEREMRERPNYKIPSVTYLHIPLFDEAVLGISHDSASEITAESVLDMPTLYRHLVTDAGSVAQIKKVMGIIGDTGRKGSVLWHCSEGKDRCGIISALFLMSKGFDYDTILQDYLKTNEVNAPKSEQHYAHILKERQDEVLAGKIRDIFLAKKEYLDAAIDGLNTIASGV